MNVHVKSVALFVSVALTLSVSTVRAEVDEGYLFRSGIWATKLIPVCWEDAGFLREKGLVQKVIRDTWQAESALNFFGWGQCLPNSVGIRIAISDETAHVKALGSALNGLSKGMVLNFTFNKWNQSCMSMRDYCLKVIAVHEFGHALAFAHEHNRPDSPRWCREKHSPQGSNGDLITGQWDEQSVMNYCNPTYNNNGSLSREDTKALRAHYGDPKGKSEGDGEKLLAAAWAGDLAQVEKYLTPETFYAQDPKEQLNALMMAADKCHLSVAKYILNSGMLTVQDVNRRNKWRDTALAIALGTDGELRKKGIYRPRCAELAPMLLSFGGQQ